MTPSTTTCTHLTYHPTIPSTAPCSSGTAFARRLTISEGKLTAGMKRNRSEPVVSPCETEITKRLRIMYNDKSSSDDSSDESEPELNSVSGNIRDLSTLAQNRSLYNALTSTSKKKVNTKTPPYKGSNAPNSTPKITDIQRELDIQWKLENGCRTGDLDSVTTAIKYEADLNSEFTTDEPPLFLACVNNHFGICQLLLSRGACITPSLWKLALNHFVDGDETLILLFLCQQCPLHGDPSEEQTNFRAINLEKILRMALSYEPKLTVQISERLLSIWLDIHERADLIKKSKYQLSESDYSLILQLLICNPSLVCTQYPILLDINNDDILHLFELLIRHQANEQLENKHYDMMLKLFKKLPIFDRLPFPISQEVSTGLLMRLMDSELIKQNANAIPPSHSNRLLTLLKSGASIDQALSETPPKLKSQIVSQLLKIFFEQINFTLNEENSNIIILLLKKLPPLDRITSPIPKEIATELFQKTTKSLLTGKNKIIRDTYCFNALLTLLRNGAAIEPGLVSVSMCHQSQIATQLFKTMIKERYHAFDRGDFNVMRILLEKEANPAKGPWHHLLNIDNWELNADTFIEKTTELILERTQPYQAAFNIVCHRTTKDMSATITRRFLTAGMEVTHECLEKAIYHENFRIFCLLLESRVQYAEKLTTGTLCTDKLLYNFQIRKSMGLRLSHVCNTLNIKGNDPRSMVINLQRKLISETAPVLPLKKLCRRIIYNLEEKIGMSITKADGLPEHFRQQLDIDAEQLRMNSSIDKYLYLLLNQRYQSKQPILKQGIGLFSGENI